MVDRVGSSKPSNQAHPASSAKGLSKTGGVQQLEQMKETASKVAGATTGKISKAGHHVITAKTPNKSLTGDVNRVTKGPLKDAIALAKEVKRR